LIGVSLLFAIISDILVFLPRNIAFLFLFARNHRDGRVCLGAGAHFCRRGLKCFSPLTGINSKTTYDLLSHFFRLNTLKGTAKARTLDFLMLNTLRGTTSTLPFYIGVPPSPGQRSLWVALRYQQLLSLRISGGIRISHRNP